MIRTLFSLMAFASSVVSGASMIMSVVSADDSDVGKSERSRSSTWKEIYDKTNIMLMMWTVCERR